MNDKPDPALAQQDDKPVAPQVFRCLELPLPKGFKRMESGALMFGENDWPGVFLRGDYASTSSMHLKSVLEQFGSKMELAEYSALNGLMMSLDSANTYGMKIEGMKVK